MDSKAFCLAIASLLNYAQNRADVLLSSTADTHSSHKNIVLDIKESVVSAIVMISALRAEFCAAAIVHGVGPGDLWAKVNETFSGVLAASRTEFLHASTGAGHAERELRVRSLLTRLCNETQRVGVGLGLSEARLEAQLHALSVLLRRVIITIGDLALAEQHSAIIEIVLVASMLIFASELKSLRLILRVLKVIYKKESLATWAQHALFGMSVNNEDVLLRLRKAGIPIRVIRVVRKRGKSLNSFDQFNNMHKLKFLGLAIGKRPARSVQSH
ncbi:predicted protein [Postia placenta Mad-698-R]|nr:predicted protein [Postia placenta Mad-698-R]